MKIKTSLLLFLPLGMYFMTCVHFSSQGQKPIAKPVLLKQYLDTIPETPPPPILEDTLLPPPPPPPPPPKPRLKGEPPIMIKVENPPRFPGCEDRRTKEEKEKCAKEKLMGFVYKNLNYPEEAKVAGIEGTVLIQFIVEKDGKISTVEIVEDIGGGCGEEAKRVVELMNKQGLRFTPQSCRGPVFRYLMKLPIEFNL